MMMTRFRFWLSFALIALLVGCNTDLPLTGTVTYTDDNSPVPMGTITCYSTGGENLRFSGTIKEDGTYEITNAANKGKAGLPAGDYTVVVTGSKLIRMNPVTNTGEYEPLVASKYGDPKTSGLVVTIPHEGPFDIKVDKAAPQR